MSTKNRVLILAERIAKDMIEEQTQARLQISFDAAFIAAHRVFGLGPGRAQAFSDAYNSAMNELAQLFIDDGDWDATLEYAKAKRDEAIRSIVGDELFVPFERSYGKAYMDELRRIRLGGE